MCGIGGIWRRKGGPADHMELRRLMSAIGHRGPEGAAFARLDAGRLLLGFLLLGFTDGGLAQQPLFNEDHTIALVYNGEIYDYAELRGRLEARGHRFRTHSDSEVILHLYEEHGEAFCDYLNGEFAFVLWDGRTDELVLVRDRFGVKPLLYAARGDAFVFASEAKGLHAIDGIEARLDPEYFAGPGVGVADNAQTAFVGIRSVRPGHIVRITRGGAALDQRYFRPAFGEESSTPRPRSLDEAASAVAETLRRAVRRRLDGDPPIALSLSSGVDSTILCGLYAEDQRARGRTAHAFSIGYDFVAYDESAIAERTAKHHGATFHRVRCDAASLADGLLEAVYATEVPTNSLSTTARVALTRAVRAAGFKALMSGEGSDELFGGYPYFGVEAIWRLVLDPATRDAGERALGRFAVEEARSRGMFWESGDAWRTRGNAYGYPSAYRLRMLRATKAMQWLFSHDWLRRMDGVTPAVVCERELDPAWLRGLAPFDASRAIARSVLGSLVIPALGDRVEMENSLEGRVPYLDLDLIQLAYGLPEQWLVDPERNVRKLVLRRAFERTLPPDHQAPPKHTLMAPTLADMARAPRGRELFEALLSERALRDAGIFDLRVVRGLRAAWRLWPERDARHTSLDLTLTYVLMTQALHAVHVGDLLGKRGASPRLALDQDRSPPAAAAGAPGEERVP